jgi:uncharacterized Zn finger protein
LTLGLVSNLAASDEEWMLALALVESASVIALSEHPEEIWAIVEEGDARYDVTFRIFREEFDWFCDCPMGAQGLFCRHCIAVAEAILGETKSGRGRHR